MNEQIQTFINELKIQFDNGEREYNFQYQKLADMGLFDIYNYLHGSAEYETWRMKVLKYLKQSFHEADIKEIVQLLNSSSITTGIKDRIIGQLNFLASEPIEKNPLPIQDKKYNKKESSQGITVNVTNQNHATATNQINIEIIFENAKQIIENSDSLSEEQTKEALEKLGEIKSIIESSEKKKLKWTKLGNIIKWVADKAVDVGMVFLTVIAQGLR